MIDPGHGGIDSGAIGTDGLLEKDVTLEFALELVRQLRAGGKLEAILTRDGRQLHLALRERVDVARNNHATLFVSVHADTVREDYVRGATVYTLSDEASDALAAGAGGAENRSDILAGLALEDQPDDVADILFDLARRETRNLSVRFAQTLVEELARQRAAEQQSVAPGVVQGAEGAGCPVGAARTRLPVQPGGREALPVRRLATQEAATVGAGGRGVPRRTGRWPASKHVVHSQHHGVTFGTVARAWLCDPGFCRSLIIVTLGSGVASLRPDPIGQGAQVHVTQTLRLHLRDWRLHAS